MVDPEHPNDRGDVVDLLHNPVRTATRRPQTSQLPLESVPDAPRDVNEGAEHELGNRGCDTCRQTGMGTFHGRRDAHRANLDGAEPRTPTRATFDHPE